MKTAFLFLLLTFGCITLNAQSTKITLSGTVKDAGGGKVLPFVTIALRNAADNAFVVATITSDAGIFSIDLPETYSQRKDKP